MDLRTGQLQPAVILITYGILLLTILGLTTSISTTFLTRIATSEAAADRAKTAAILANHPGQRTHEIAIPDQEFNYTGGNNAELRFQTGVIPLSNYGRSVEITFPKADYSSPKDGFFDVSKGLCFQKTQGDITLSGDCSDQ